MNALHYLVLLICIAVPALIIAWRHETKKSAKRDRQRFMADKQPDDEERPGGFIDLRNAHNVERWRRRYIAAHPQTIVRQRFPTLELLAHIDVRTCKDYRTRFTNEPADISGLNRSPHRV